MSISKRDVWVAEISEYGPGEVVNLAPKETAPDTFESQDEIETYIQNEFSIGDYHILGIDQTVTVTPTHEMYFEYSDADMSAINDAYTAFDDADGVVSVQRVSDPAGREIHMQRFGTSVYLSPYDRDLDVEVFNEDGDDESVVAEWVSERADGLRVLGCKRGTYRERRGACGQSTVRVALKRDVGAVPSLIEYVKDVPQVQFCTAIESVLFVPRVVPRGESVEYVLVTDLELKTESSHLDNDPTPEMILELLDAELPEFREQFESETDWGVSAYGFVTTTGSGSLYRLAIGVTRNLRG